MQHQAWIQRAALAAIFAAMHFVSACNATDASDRVTIFTPRAGGQTGSEGACVKTGEPPPFTQKDVRALIGGDHVMRVANRPFYKAHPLDGFASETGLAAKLHVELEGDLWQMSDAECGDAMQQDVVLTLSFDEPKVDLIIEGTFTVFSDSFAVMFADVDTAAAEALGLPAPDESVDFLQLQVAFMDGEVKGYLTTGSGQCGVMVFPAGAHCPEWGIREIDPNKKLSGFVPSDVMQQVAEQLVDLPLQWDDGSETTLTLEIDQAPEWGCSSLEAEPCSSEVDLPLMIHAKTADQRVDLTLPGHLNLYYINQLALDLAVCIGSSQDSLGWTGEFGIGSSVLSSQQELTTNGQHLDIAFTRPKDAVKLAVGAGRDGFGGSIHAGFSAGALTLEAGLQPIEGILDLNQFGKPGGCYGQPQTVASAETPPMQ